MEFRNNSFLAVDFDEFEDKVVEKHSIDIRIQARSGRKCWTFIEGIEDEDLKDLLRELKRKFKTNGAILTHDTFGEIIQLQGDFREQVCEYLISKELYSADQIRIHGF